MEVHRNTTASASPLAHRGAVGYLFAETCFQPPLASKALHVSPDYQSLYTLSCTLCLASLYTSSGLSLLSFLSGGHFLVYVRTNHSEETKGRRDHATRCPDTQSMCLEHLILPLLLHTLQSYDSIGALCSSLFKGRRILQQ